MEKIEVLILFANPKTTIPLQLTHEQEIIYAAIFRSKYKRKFKLTFIEASTIHDLRRALLKSDFQIVHFSAHGTNSGLILEDERGEPHQIPPEALAELLKGYKSIECVILNACYAVSQGALIASGNIYTIAMEDKLDDQAAIEFSRGFYDAIGAGKDYAFAHQQGCINVKLTHPDALFRSVFLPKDASARDAYFIDKSKLSPAINEDSFKKQSNTSKDEKAGAPLHLKIGIPPLPDIFLGRGKDLGILKERLGIIKGGKDSGAIQILAAFQKSPRKRNSIAALRGFPGIGKTALATVLAEDEEVIKAFPDGVLWASLGQTANLIHLMASWASEFGSDDVFRAPTLRQAVERLSGLLRKKRLLMVLDDVWEVEHVSVFKQALGNDCSLLVATRAPQIINELSIRREAIYNLPGLAEDTALELLEILAPTVVPAYRRECIEIVRALECLPLALHVAGRLLNEESQQIWGVEELLKTLREGESLLEKTAPADSIDLEKQTIPTVAALLRKSVDSLDAQAQLCFAYLAPYHEKTALTLEDFKVSWQMDDPRPIVKQLTGRGLLEPVGDHYRMHSLLNSLARSLLKELK